MHTAEGCLAPIPPTPWDLSDSQVPSVCSALCCVRQKLPEAERKASDRLWPLPPAQAGKGLPCCGFFPRPPCSPVEGSRPRTAQRPKHQLAAGLSPQDPRHVNNRPPPERGGKGGELQLLHLQLADTGPSGSQAADQRPMAPWAVRGCPGGPAPRQGGKAPKACSSGKICFQKGLMARICFPGIGQGCAASGELWGLLGDFRTRRGGGGASEHPCGGIKSAFLLPAPISGGFALSQPSTLSGDPGGWGVALVHLKGQLPPLWDPSSQPIWGEAGAERGRLTRGWSAGSAC